MKNNKFEEVINLLKQYSFTEEEKEYYIKVIKPIYLHPEFQKRKKYLHHSNISLVTHILEVSILSYNESLKYNNKVNTKLVILISIMHDLYCIPWQNNKSAEVKHFFNKHGFRHPLEAIINSINWFSDYFIDEEESRIIIDGVLHHMYPLGVRILDESDMELRNNDLLKKLNPKYIKIIKESTSRGVFSKISISKSKYIEGRIVSKCDKIISRKQIKNLSSAFSLLTGKNKSLDKEE